MVLRNIVKIDENKCDGCGLCISACAEGAIKLINGKAKLISETYCDGLGACLGHCPQDAITVEQRQCAEFDEKAVDEHLEKEKTAAKTTAGSAGKFVCPGIAAKKINKPKSPADGNVASQLSQWPIQLSLISPAAQAFDDTSLLIAADCVAFAMGDFHSKLLKGKSVVIACPKLDETAPYISKLAEIFAKKNIKSLTVAHMEVPCCFGLRRIVEEAINKSGKKIAFQNLTVGIGGEVIKTETIEK